MQVCGVGGLAVIGQVVVGAYVKDQVVASTGRIGGEVALCAKLYAERVPSDRVCTDCV